MKNQIETINTLISELLETHTLMNNNGADWGGILLTELRLSMHKLVEARKLLEKF